MKSFYHITTPAYGGKNHYRQQSYSIYLNWFLHYERTLVLAEGEFKGQVSAIALSLTQKIKGGFNKISA